VLGSDRPCELVLSLEESPDLGAWGLGGLALGSGWCLLPGAAILASSLDINTYFSPLFGTLRPHVSLS